MELREKCLTTYGGKCNMGSFLCHLCLIKYDVNEISRKFEANTAASETTVGYFRNMDLELIKLCKKLAPTKTLALTVDNFEQMLISCGLELLRQGINTHCRGIHLSSASRLDHLLNATRATLIHDDIGECTSFADVMESNFTAWNDCEVNKPGYLRSHFLHFEATFQIGYGLNVTNKKSWNGRNMDGVRATEKELKKKLRIINFNDELSTKFSPPIFDLDKGTYDKNLIEKADNDDLERPLIPIKTNTSKKVLIR